VEPDAIVRGEQLGQMLVVAAGVGRAGQLDDLGHHPRSQRMPGSPPPVPMHERAWAVPEQRLLEPPHLAA
jgi:hypothetical protein